MIVAENAIAILEQDVRVTRHRRARNNAQGCGDLRRWHLPDVAGRRSASTT
jgi:hypothetical protein